MDFEELMRVVYAAISSVEDGKVGEVDIEREFSEDDRLTITVCANPRPFIKTTATIEEDLPEGEKR